MSTHLTTAIRPLCAVAVRLVRSAVRIPVPTTIQPRSAALSASTETPVVTAALRSAPRSRYPGLCNPAAVRRAGPLVQPRSPMHFARQMNLMGAPKGIAGYASAPSAHRCAEVFS